MTDAIENQIKEHILPTLENHEKKLQRHETILVGEEGIEENGLVDQMRQLRELIKILTAANSTQKVYNGILLFFAVTLGGSVLALMWNILTHVVTVVRTP